MKHFSLVVAIMAAIVSELRSLEDKVTYLVHRSAK